MKDVWLLALRYLFKGKAKHISFISIISCLAVAVGISTLVVVISVMNGFDRDLTDKLLRFNYHLTVEGIDRQLSLSLIEKVKKIEEVVSANFYIHTQIFAKFDNLIVPLFVRGIAWSDPHEKEVFHKYVVEEKAKGEFFIGEGLRRRFGLEEKIQFYPLKKKFELVEKRIKGVFKVGLYDVDNSYVVCSVEEAKNLSENYFLFLGVRVKDPFKVDKVKAKLKEVLGEEFIVNSWIDYNRTLFSALKLEKITMFIILSLIVLVASFNIFATLTVKVVEKTKDIGILRALGFTSKKVLFIFSLQGGLLGTIGVVLGMVLGVALSLFLKQVQFVKIPQEIYYIEYLPVCINGKDILVIALTGVLLSFFSSIMPAIRASRLLPVEALRYE